MNQTTDLTTPWFCIKDDLPEELETVWISNGKGFTVLGCLVYDENGWQWAISNGIIYEENGKIVAECESDDLDVIYWARLPKAPQCYEPNLLENPTS